MIHPKIEECGEEEARELLRRLGLEKPASSPGLLGELHGEVEAVCRESDGSVAWKIHQKNLVTDSALRRFALGWHEASLLNTFNSVLIFLSPSTEPPVSGRYTLPDDGTGVVPNNGGAAGGGPTNPVYTASTLTWTYSYTFGGANRQIGTIGLSAMYAATWNTNGIGYLWASTLINPPKIQTVNQTVETVYRINLVPLY